MIKPDHKYDQAKCYLCCAGPATRSTPRWRRTRGAWRGTPGSWWRRTWSAAPPATTAPAPAPSLHLTLRFFGCQFGIFGVFVIIRPSCFEADKSSVTVLLVHVAIWLFTLHKIMHSLFSEFDKNMPQVQLELVASVAWDVQSQDGLHQNWFVENAEMMMMLVLSRYSRDRSAPCYHWSRVTLRPAGLCHTLPSLSWNRLLWIILHCTEYLLSSPHSLIFFIQFWSILNQQLRYTSY